MNILLVMLDGFTRTSHIQSLLFNTSVFHRHFDPIVQRAYFNQTVVFTNTREN